MDGESAAGIVLQWVDGGSMDVQSQCDDLSLRVEDFEVVVQTLARLARLVPNALLCRSLHLTDLKTSLGVLCASIRVWKCHRIQLPEMMTQLFNIRHQFFAVHGWCRVRYR